MTLPAILLVEDDPSLGYILNEYLSLNHFQVTWLKDGTSVVDHLRRQAFDLCILDVMLPKKDGFTLANEIRVLIPEQPIIFLTAKSLKVDKLKGFRLGADDFITKPIDEEELVARITAVINRTTRHKSMNEFLDIGSFKFDTINLTLTIADDILQLSTREAEILKLLSVCSGRLVDRRKILTELWGSNDYFARRSMDVIVSRLRKCLKADPAVSIVTVHGKGFILRCNS